MFSLPQRAGRLVLIVVSLACLALTSCGSGSHSAGARAVSAPVRSSTTAGPTVTVHHSTAPAHAARTRPPAGRSPSQSAAALRLDAAVRDFALCIRRHGVSYPEPGAIRTRGAAPVGMTSRGYQAAAAQCRPAVIVALKSLAPAPPK
jgi:hypothetical protein